MYFLVNQTDLKYGEESLKSLALQSLENCKLKNNEITEIILILINQSKDHSPKITNEWTAYF